MTYKEFVKGYISDIPISKPIFVSDISRLLKEEYSIPLEKASAAVSVAIKRIRDKGLIPELRFFQKGIYYRTMNTLFGEIGIDKEEIIKRKYLENGKGYDTGLWFLHKIGLTTQIPNNRVLNSNESYEKPFKDIKLGVIVNPPKTEITPENKDYLQLLDTIELMDRAPIDVDNPYDILAEYVNEKGLKYEILLSLADKYYHQKTVLRLARIASEGDYVSEITLR